MEMYDKWDSSTSRVCMCPFLDWPDPTRPRWSQISNHMSRGPHYSIPSGEKRQCIFVDIPPCLTNRSSSSSSTVVDTVFSVFVVGVAVVVAVVVVVSLVLLLLLLLLLLLFEWSFVDCCYCCWLLLMLSCCWWFVVSFSSFSLLFSCCQ